MHAKVGARIKAKDIRVYRLYIIIPSQLSHTSFPF